MLLSAFRTTVQAVLAAILLVGASAAQAATITYDFAGVLVSGNDAVSGTFTLDNGGAGTITAFDFKDAAGHFEFDAANASANVLTLVATSPNATFVELLFPDGSSNALGLFFETTLPSFDASTFLTGPVSGGFGNGGSFVLCNLAFGGCNDTTLFASGFASGAATSAARFLNLPR